MYWIYLLIAGLFEVLWALGLKLSNGFEHIVISVFTVIGMILSFYFLALALKSIPLGTAYAVWTGIGTIGTVILGIIIFNEPLNIAKILCILLVILGIIGLKLLTQ